MSSQPKEARSSWTVLVYLAGDNNLTEEMVWGLQELKKTANMLRSKQARPESGINVFAHFDPRGSRGRRYDFVPPSDINSLKPGDGAADGNLDRYEAMIYTPGVVAAQAKQFNQNGAGSAAHSNQLAAFLQEQIARIPLASEYFLILSGHGSGAIGDFLIDLDPATSLSIPELARILRDGRTAYAQEHREYEPDEPEVPKRIGVVGMDSCLMSNAEVCYEIRDDAKFLVASEGWVSKAGWPYHRALEACAGAGPDAKRAALEVAEKYSLFYKDYEISGFSTDIAVCDLSRFRSLTKHDLVGCIRDLSRECTRWLETQYVHDIVARPALGREAANDLRANLSHEIADRLLTLTEPKEALAAELRDGSQGAVKFLFEGDPSDLRLSPSQRTAVRQLLEVINGPHDLENDALAERLGDTWAALQKQVQKPDSRQIALAVVRVLREFDPGIQKALQLIEKQEVQGRSTAKLARASLLKLHQVQVVLDLMDKTSNLPPDPPESVLRDAVVAARWQAQSFKGGVYVDLFDLCGCLSVRLPKGRVKDLCEAVQTRIENPEGGGAVLRSHYTGPDFQHAHGLSVYFPCQSEDYHPEYENLAFARATGWGRLVRAYLRTTRRERRDEARHWAEAAHHVLRSGDAEVDPLETDSIEARIAGVAGRHPSSSLASVRKLLADMQERLRGGIEGKAKGGVEGKAKGGVEGKAKGGIEGKAKGTEAKIRGEGSLAVWGNPPDGFFRQ